MHGTGAADRFLSPARSIGRCGERRSTSPTCCVAERLGTDVTAADGPDVTAADASGDRGHRLGGRLGWGHRDWPSPVGRGAEWLHLAEGIGTPAAAPPACNIRAISTGVQGCPAVNCGQPEMAPDQQLGPLWLVSEVR
jgi:hypothetical protein